MSLQKYKAVGRIGSWFATIGETPYPCVHNHWVRWEGGRLIYVDPSYDPPSQPKWVEFIEALTTEQKAILTKDKVLGPSGRGVNFKRDGYIALYQIDNLAIDQQTLRFEFISRLADLE
jgi:hypothetical protein